MSGVGSACPEGGSGTAGTSAWTVSPSNVPVPCNAPVSAAAICRTHRAEIDLADHLAYGNHVILAKNRLTVANAVPVDKGAVLATQVADSQSVLVEQENAVVTADELAFRSELAILFAADQQFAVLNGD